MPKLKSKTKKPKVRAKAKKTSRKIKAKSGQRRKVAAIGGGTGTFVILQGLRRHPVWPVAIVTMADDGGSTGRLRDEIGVLPPGDVRRALLALASSDEIWRDLLNYRFAQGAGLAGHSFGNLFLTALERLCGDFSEAIKRAGRILDICGEVIPVTLNDTRLFAKLEDGRIIEGEANIDIPQHDPKVRIKEVYLEPATTANPQAIRAILEAEKVIIGPGDLYTSLIPNLLVPGVKEALRQTKARVIYVVNLMTKRGETDGFTVSRFMEVLQNYLEPGTLDAVIVNQEQPPSARLRAYSEEGSQFVEPDTKKIKGVQVITGQFLTKAGLIRHEPGKIAEAILQL
jgi:uncharacterized cofD-like protein